jgi:hypothetical protein
MREVFLNGSTHSTHKTQRVGLGGGVVDFIGVIKFYTDVSILCNNILCYIFNTSDLLLRSEDIAMLDSKSRRDCTKFYVRLHIHVCINRFQIQFTNYDPFING